MIHVLFILLLIGAAIAAIKLVFEDRISGKVRLSGVERVRVFEIKNGRVRDNQIQLDIEQPRDGNESCIWRYTGSLHEGDITGTIEFITKDSNGKTTSSKQEWKAKRAGPVQK